jgi:hypothetical protein
VHQNLINFPGADLLAAAVDDFLQSTCDAEEALIVQHALIARAKPAVDKGIRIGLVIIFITRGDIGAANDDFAGFSSGQEAALFAKNADFRSSGLADGSRLSLGRRQGVGRHLVTRFGHAVRLHQWRVEQLLDLLNELRRNRR